MYIYIYLEVERSGEGGGDARGKALRVTPHHKRDTEPLQSQQAGCAPESVGGGGA